MAATTSTSSTALFGVRPRAMKTRQLQLQVCNATLVICGLTAVGLAGSQFSAVGLDNYRLVDVRLLNFFHALAGGIGLYCVAHNHGSVVCKSLYAVSLCLGVATAIFYGFTTHRVVDSYQRLMQFEGFAGFQQQLGAHADAQAGKVAIAAASLGVAALAALVALVAIVLLDRLVVPESAWTLVTRESELEHKLNSSQLASIAIVKLVLGLGALGLAAYLEYNHELLGAGGRGSFINIALDHFAAMLVVTSAIVDLVAVHGRRRTMLNLKVSCGLSLVAATWILKSIDNNMHPFYTADIDAQRRVDAALFGPPPFFGVSTTIGGGGGSTSGGVGTASIEYVIVIVHGVLLGALAVVFTVCAFGAVLGACCLRRELAVVERQLTKQAVTHSRSLGLLHVLWSAGLLALVVIGLLRLPWSGDFVGGDLLWLAVLFFSTGVLGSTNMNVLANVKFVMNSIAFGVAIEKLAVSVHLIYQSATFWGYSTDFALDTSSTTGRIVLHSCQCALLLGESLTAFVGIIVFGRHLTRGVYPQRPFSSGVHLGCSIGALLYGIVMTGCYVVFELGKWRFNQVPLDVAFFRLTNGPFALVVFGVQVLCGIYKSAFLVPATILQTILASLALFVLSSCITNVYYLSVMLDNEELLNATSDQHTILVVALILAATAATIAVFTTIASVCSVLRSSYIMHKRPLGGDLGEVVRLDAAVAPSTVASTSPHHAPLGTTASVQPIIEEQTVQLTLDDDPHVVKSSTRYYVQPYAVERSTTSPTVVANYGREPRRLSAAAIGDDFADGDRSLKIADVRAETRVAPTYFYSNN